jgi:hypothetical protein
MGHGDTIYEAIDQAFNDLKKNKCEKYLRLENAISNPQFEKAQLNGSYLPTIRGDRISAMHRKVCKPPRVFG